MEIKVTLTQSEVNDIIRDSLGISRTAIIEIVQDDPKNTFENSGVWVDNTQGVPTYPDTLSRDDQIEVEFYDGETDIGAANDWINAWDLYSPIDAIRIIKRYRKLSV